MKRKITIIGAVLLGLIVLTALAVPVFAAGDSGAAPPSTQITQQANKIWIMARLLLVQDGAKIDAFLAKAQDSGKITAAQAVKIKTFWTNHHKQFAKRVVISRLLRAKDGAKVQAFLDKVVAANKITKEQADKFMEQWHKLHSK